MVGWSVYLYSIVSILIVYTWINYEEIIIQAMRYERDVRREKKINQQKKLKFLQKHGKHNSNNKVMRAKTPMTNLRGNSLPPSGRNQMSNYQVGASPRTSRIGSKQLRFYSRRDSKQHILSKEEKTAQIVKQVEKSMEIIRQHSLQHSRSVPNSRRASYAARFSVDLQLENENMEDTNSLLQQIRSSQVKYKQQQHAHHTQQQQQNEKACIQASEDDNETGNETDREQSRNSNYSNASHISHLSHLSHASHASHASMNINQITNNISSGQHSQQQSRQTTPRAAMTGREFGACVGPSASGHFTKSKSSQHGKYLSTHVTLSEDFGFDLVGSITSGMGVNNNLNKRRSSLLNLDLKSMRQRNASIES